MRRKSLLGSVAFSLAGVLALSAPASAIPPQTEPFVMSGSWLDPSCVDPIRADWTANEVFRTFLSSSGEPIRLQVTGRATTTFTDLVNGRTYSPPSSGPGTYDLRTGALVLRGGNAAVVDQQGRLVSTRGRVVLDADNNMISLVGRAVDVCSRLGTFPQG